MQFYKHVTYFLFWVDNNSHGSQIKIIQQTVLPSPFFCPPPTLSLKRTILLSFFFLFAYLFSISSCRYECRLILCPLSTPKVAHYLLCSTPCFFHFNNISWRSFHITAWRVSMFSLNATQYSIVWMIHSLFHWSPTNGYLNCFQSFLL